MIQRGAAGHLHKTLVFFFETQFIIHLKKKKNADHTFFPDNDFYTF